MVVIGKREVNRDGLFAQAHFQRYTVVGNQQAQLLAVVMGKQVGAGQRGLVSARAFYKTIGDFGVRTRHRGGLHAHKRVVGVNWHGRCLTRHKALHGAAQVLDLFPVQLLNLDQSLCRVGMESAALMSWCRRIEGHALLSL